MLFDRDLDNLVSQTSNLSDLEIVLKLQQIIYKNKEILIQTFLGVNI